MVKSLPKRGQSVRLSVLGGLWLAEQSTALEVRHQAASNGKAIREIHQRHDQHGFEQGCLVPPGA
jgi:hypothetical protein